MFCKSFCAAIVGVEAKIIQIEADVNDGMPIFQLVGCLNSEVREAKERVRSAIKNIGWRFPPKRVTVNLSPADVRKEGTLYDVGIAVALLNSFEYFNFRNLDKILFAGELSLDGHINAVNGILPVVLAAKSNGFDFCVVPKGNINECIIVDGIHIIGVSSLSELITVLENEKPEIYACETLQWNDNNKSKKSDKDFSDVIGQTMIKRATMIAVAGGHNMLMQGPPGAGKTMIAERIPGIMPSLTKEESFEVAKIKSISNSIEKSDGFVYERPFRMPHHSIPPTGLIGGGSVPRTGEISLAHKGVLFLDELTEYQRDTIELLRIPLEKKKIIHTRNNMTVEFPCDFMLVAAMNPCPCGYFPDRIKCKCTPLQIKKYIGRISYPLLDRIDIIAQVRPVEFCNINSKKVEYEESSEYMRERINRVIDVQNERFKNDDISRNAMMTRDMINEFCSLDKKTRKYFEDVFEKAGFSARAYFKVLKIARTIADFDEKENIEMEHIREAVLYRSFERTIFDGMNYNGGD